MSRMFIRRQSTEVGSGDFVLDVGQHVLTAEEQFESEFGDITSLERDLLLLGASVFAIDRGVPRGEREEFARSLELSIPITNIGKLQPLITSIERTLRFLSNDRWTVQFRQQPGVLETKVKAVAKGNKTLLFSGGLDSLAASVEFGQGEDLCLVSHITRNLETKNTQHELVALLGQSGIVLPHYQFFVSSRDCTNFDHDSENTQRTRSFLFLILGALVARRLEHKEIVMMAENGQLAIHLPLNSARIGAFSTHTAHPDFIVRMEGFLNSALDTHFKVSNPYVLKTKSETISVLVSKFTSAIPVANSCWRNAHLPQGKTHCGECIPCFVRRIAIEFHVGDVTAYNRDVWGNGVSELLPDDEGRRNLIDLCEFILQFEKDSLPQLMDKWPELYSPNLDSNATIAMYRRSAAEARTVLSRYPSVLPLLQ